MKLEKSTNLFTFLCAHLMCPYVPYVFQNTKRLSKNFLYIIITSLLVACQSGNVENKNNIHINLQNDTTIKYAKGFSVQSTLTYTIINVLGAKRDTTTKYVLYKTEKPVLKSNIPLYTIKVPCQTIAALSSIYSAMLCDLDASSSIKAIDNIDYYNHPIILNKHLKGELKELVKGPEIDIEKTIALMPDIIFSFGMVNETPKYSKWLTQKNIPLVLSFDHLEKNALARAEWLKFFALFVDKRKTADSIFLNVETNYNRLKKLAASQMRHPSVLCELKYGDVWYVPGGKSSVAQLIKDASGAYFWESDTASGSLPLSFEAVYHKANNCDIWINTTSANSLKDVINQDKRYAAFNAFKTKQVFNYTKHQNSKGYSDYWETAIIYPDRIVNDLMRIFHPNLKDSLADFYYYKKLE
jgi:iron complex transport system substrate-binding protein